MAEVASTRATSVIVGGPSFGGGRYELRAKLGEGGMGIVYEAFDLERLTLVALKTLPSMDGDAILRFKNEFRALQDLQHPNLVALRELALHDGTWFFTMELVRGVDFLRYVRGEDEPRAEDSQGTTAPRETPSDDRTRGSSREEATRASGSASRTLAAAAAQEPPGSGVMRAISSRPPSADGVRVFDEGRLRSALRQVTRGLMALHADHKVHRDIKPSNILVTSKGNAKILDFGLITDRVHDLVGDATQVVGTPAYMAPEQANGEPAGPAVDWYSVGVMLHIALAGVHPFSGSVELVQQLKQSIDPPPPSALLAPSAPPLPPDLDALCAGLLRRDPKERLDAVAILNCLHSPSNSKAPSSRASAMPRAADVADIFVGRDAELRTCECAFKDSLERQTTLLVRGESGVGKSALVGRFCTILAETEPRAIVLRGRCYERESVPFKAVDSLVDALSQELLKMSAAELAEVLPVHVGRLAHVFPVLRRVDAVVRAPRASTEVAGPDAQRAQFFATFRELFARLAARRPLVLVIDDLQWTDGDSLSLLRDLVSPPDAPPLLILATIRAGAEILATESSAEYGSLPGNLRELSVAGLPSDEARELAELLLAQFAPAESPSVAQASDAAGRRDEMDAQRTRVLTIAQEAGGHPLFIDELVRYARSAARGDAGERVAGSVRLDQALATRIDRLEAGGRCLLELVALAGTPLTLEAAALAAQMDFEELESTLGALRVGRLVRTSGARLVDHVEPYHDRVRSCVITHVAAWKKTTLHERLGFALESTSREREPEALARHWKEANLPDRAAPYAVVAAERAMKLFAFHRAAELYRMALELLAPADSRRAALGEKLGDALTYAGHGVEAADAYLAVADALAPAAATLATELRRRAALQLLQTGSFERGLRELDTVLATVDLEVPKTPLAALTSLLARRVHVRLRGLSFRERPVAEIPPELLRRVDICSAATWGLGMIDILRGSDFQSRELLLALEAGEVNRVCRAISAECLFSATDGSSSSKRTHALLGKIEAMVTRLGNPTSLRAIWLAARGCTAHLEGRYPEVPPLMAQARAAYGQEWTETSRFEIDNALVFEIGAIAWLGQLGELRRRFPALLDEARERGNVMWLTHFRMGVHTHVWLLDDDVAWSRELMDDAIRPWSPERVNLPTFMGFYTRGELALYSGNAKVAHREVEEGCAVLGRAFMMRCQLVRVHMLDARARAALAMWSGAAAGDKSHLRQASRDADKLIAEGATWAKGLGFLVHAQVAACRGETDRVREHLETASRASEEVGMSTQLAVARHHLAPLVGGEQGKELKAQADAWFQAQGCKNPPRFRQMMAPGFAPLEVSRDA